MSYTVRDARIATDEDGNIRVTGISNYRFISRYGSLGDAMDDLPTSGVVIVEPGTWDVGGYTVSQSSNKGIIGLGKTSIIDNSDTTDTDKHTVEYDGTAASHISNVLIKNVKFTGETGGGYGLYLDYVDDFLLKNIWMDGVGDTGIYMSNCTDGRLENVNLQSSASGYGIYMDSCNNLSLDRIYTYQNYDSGIYIKDSDRNMLSNINLVDDGDYAIELDSSDRVEVSNGILRNATTGGARLTGTCQHVKFSNIDSSNHDAGDGWQIESGCDYTIITGCTATGNPAYGIDIQSGADNTVIIGGRNPFAGNTTDSVNNNGTDTEWIKEGFERSMVAWDETELSYTDSTGDTWSLNDSEKKDFRVIQSNSHGFQMSDLHICAEMKVDAGTGSLGIFVDGGGSSSLTLTTTSNTYEIQTGSFSVSWSNDTIHTITVKYKNSGSGNTTYNRTFECYAGC